MVITFADELRPHVSAMTRTNARQESLAFIRNSCALATMTIKRFPDTDPPASAARRIERHNDNHEVGLGHGFEALLELSEKFAKSKLVPRLLFELKGSWPPT